MAFPWTRRDEPEQMLPAERRRRSRSRRNRQAVVTREPSRSDRERLHQRLVWTVGAVLLLVVAGVVAFGFYDKFLKPPRVWAGSVRNVEFTMGDLVQRIRVLQGITGEVDLSIIPFQYLDDMVNAEVLRQAAPGLGITVTDEEVDNAIRSQFMPEAAEGDQTDPGQLDEEFRQTFSEFLTRTGLSEDDFQGIMREQITQLRLRQILGETIEDEQEQVEVEWIRLETRGEVEPDEVLQRLEIEEFGVVAAEVGVPRGFANSNGYVGWVPLGAFPELDDFLFGNEEREIAGEKLIPPEPDSTIGPIFTSTGFYIIHVISAPEVREISDLMRAKLNNELLAMWYADQTRRGGEEGWRRVNLNSELYAWVAEQVNISTPRDRFPQP